MFNLKGRIASGAVLGLLLAGCPGTLGSEFFDGGNNGDGGTGGCDDIDVPADIFASTSEQGGCARMDCHSSGTLFPPELADANSIAGLTDSGNCGIPWITPGDPDSSLLYLKLLANPPAACPSRMPLLSAPLDDATIACVADWISGL